MRPALRLPPQFAAAALRRRPCPKRPLRLKLRPGACPCSVARCGACAPLPAATATKRGICTGPLARRARQRPKNSQLPARPEDWRKNTMWISPSMEGSGAGGRISKRDILAAVGSGGPSLPPRVCDFLPLASARRAATHRRLPPRRLRAGGASRIPCWKTPSRASGFISATTKPSR